MSLDPLFLTAAAPVGVAAALVLGTSTRFDHEGRAFRTALRLLTGSLVLALLLAAVATFLWSDATIAGTTPVGAAAAGGVPDQPPLLAFLSLPVLAGLVRAVAVRRRSDVRSRLDIRPHADLEPSPAVGLVGGHVVRVPGPRVPVGDRLVTEALPARRVERPDAERRGDARPVG